MAGLNADLLAFSIGTSAFVTGAKLAWSFVSIPAIIKDLEEDGLPEVNALNMWYTIFDRGFFWCVPPAAMSALASFVNAYLVLHDRRLQTRLIAAGLTNLGMVPFTFAFVLGTNAILHEKRARHGKKEAGHDGAFGKSPAKTSMPTAKVLWQWALLNAARSVFPLMGALLAWSCWRLLD